MHLQRLKIENLRNLVSVDIEVAPTINLLTGGNGAGKSSVLEAIYLLGHAQSFRSGSHEALLRRDGSRLSVFAEIWQGSMIRRRVGLLREAKRWVGRVDGEAPASIAELLRECSVMCFEPGSHALISGSSELRRRFLDWAVFHVEPEFYEAARSCRRALRQRNALLRGKGGDTELDAWDYELTMWGERVHTMRQAYVESWGALLTANLRRILPELGEARLVYSRGWKAPISLGEALFDSRARDRERGFSHAGVHRADWAIEFPLAPSKDHLSRGQEKLCALGCVMSQAELHRDCQGVWPVVCLDDLASELDSAHQIYVAEWLVESGAQVFVSGTEVPTAMAGVQTSLFHVEQGQVTRLL